MWPRGGGLLDDGTPTQSLNLHLADDTDTVFAKIDRFNFERPRPRYSHPREGGKCAIRI